MRVLWITVGVVGLLVLARMSVFTVDPTEFVYVTEFGAPVAVYDGARPDEAGLHLRWPWPIQSLQRLDRRLQHFDLPATELLTHDAVGKTVDKNLTVEAYVCWRILGKDQDDSAVDRFIRRMGTPERVREILGKRLNSHLGALVGQMRMDELISDLPAEGGARKVDQTLKALQQKLLFGLQTQAGTEYGVELVDVRLRRFNHPAQVRESIFDRIRSERALKVADYLSKGEREARDIESKAEQQVRQLLAEAAADAQRRKGAADAEADRIRIQAHGQDPEFYVFLKKLEQLQSILGENKTLLLLSTRRPVFDLLFQPPRPNGTKGPPAGVADAPGGAMPPPAPAKKPAEERPPQAAGTKGGQ
jgi:membrane protease subunit HflC